MVLFPRVGSPPARVGCLVLGASKCWSSDSATSLGTCGNWLRSSRLGTLPRKHSPNLSGVGWRARVWGCGGRGFAAVEMQGVEGDGGGAAKSTRSDR